MLRCAGRPIALLTAFLALVFIAPEALAGTDVVCSDPSDPSSCKIVLTDDGSTPNSDSSSQQSNESGNPKGDSPKADTGRDDSPPTPLSSVPAIAVTNPLAPAVGECDWRLMDPQPPADDPRWEGSDPTTNSVIFNNCNGPTTYAVVPSGTDPAAAAPPPPPDPAVLAAQAIGQLRVPSPSVGMSPDPEWLAVNFWTWLYTDDPGPVSTTVELRGVSVTATASLSQVAWVMGEPVSLKNAGAGIAGVTCDGPGVAPPAKPRYDQPPPCGYMYKFRSTKERTAGTERWPVTATATWAVTWTSNTGASGTDQLQSTSSTALVRVGEYRTVGGFGSGG